MSPDKNTAIFDDASIEDLQNAFDSMSPGPYGVGAQLDGMTKEEFQAKLDESTTKYWTEQGKPVPEKTYSVLSGEVWEGNRTLVCLTGYGPTSPQNAASLAHILNNYELLLEGYRAMKESLGIGAATEGEAEEPMEKVG